MDHTSHFSATGACTSTLEEALNLYLDGELSFDLQSELYAHLAVCEACRRHLDAVMHFRRMSRQETLRVPPSVDTTFYERLARLKRRDGRIDRMAERRPLWQAQTLVSLRVAVMACVLVFISGVLVPMNADEHPPAPLVEGIEERVEFAPVERRPWSEAVYVFYPGLTVEASKIEGIAVD